MFDAIRKLDSWRSRERLLYFYAINILICTLYWITMDLKNTTGAIYDCPSKKNCFIVLIVLNRTYPKHAMCYIYPEPKKIRWLQYQHLFCSWHLLLQQIPEKNILMAGLLDRMVTWNNAAYAKSSVKRKYK